METPKTKGPRRVLDALHLSWRDAGVTLGVLCVVTTVSFFIRSLAGGESVVSMLYILGVLIISRFTTGYFYGVFSSLLSVLTVNFIFTYPYFSFNFTLTGYPIAVLCMLSVAVVTGALTTRIKLQEQLKAEAEQEKTRSNLLRAISHDLRTPLTCILGASSAIIETDDTLSRAERLRLAGQIKEDAQWLIRLVENLLTITRMDGPGGARIHKEPQAVEEVVASAISGFKKRFPQARVAVDIPSELLMVPMDALLIEQVLINLLENAALHSGDLTGIGLSVFQRESSAVFQVTDNGKGFPPEALPHILSGNYRRTIEATQDKTRSMGIGLSVCNTIIAAHNGAMAAQNRTHGGAAFRFELPLEDNQ